MRPKNLRGAPPPQQRRGDDTLRNVGIALGLLILGASLAFGGQAFLTGIGKAPSAPPDAPSLEPGPSEPLASIPEESAAPSETPASAVLEAKLPATIAGIDLTKQSATGATTLSSGPSGRALDAAVVSFGKKADELELGVAYDEAGSLDLTILGFRLPGVAAEKLETAILGAWLEADVAGVKTSSVDLSGIAATLVSYGDEGPDEYVFIEGDTVFVIETSDRSIATTAAGAIAGSPAPSAPGATAAPASAPAPSPAPTPS